MTIRCRRRRRPTTLFFMVVVNVRYCGNMNMLVLLLLKSMISSECRTWNIGRMTICSTMMMTKDEKNVVVAIMKRWMEKARHDPFVIVDVVMMVGKI
jgi:hypothetical protein